VQDLERIAVRAVERLLEPCPRLRAEIQAGDRTPITDGFIDLYSKDHSSSRADITARVALQVKGVSHYNKKKFAADSLSYSIEVEVLRFFRDNGGGVYFCVIVHPDTRQERVFARPLAPFMLDRLLNEKPDQKSISVKLKHLADDPDHVQRVMDFAAEVSKQDPKQGFDERLWRDDAELEIVSVDGVDLSRPADLNLGTQDVAIVLHTGGLRIHVNADLRIIPAGYVEREIALTVSCGGVSYDTAVVKKINDGAGQFRLGDTLTLRLEQDATHLTSELDLEQGGNLLDHLQALRFFVALAEGHTLRIGYDDMQPEVPKKKHLDGLDDTLERFEALAELFEAVGADARLVIPTDITSSQMNILGHVYRALVHGDELTSDTGRAGRFDIRVGAFRIMVVAMPGSTEGAWRFFDPFEPASRDRYRIYRMSDESTPRELHGTAYEAVFAEEIANTLNLRLDDLPRAYQALEDQETARGLANLKVLQFIAAADASEVELRRAALLEAALGLNAWLLDAGGDDAIHRINRWQVLHRTGELSSSDRDEIRDLRRLVMRSDDGNAGQLEACCAILLGDLEDIRHTINALDVERKNALASWPIATLIPDGRASGLIALD
jgi:hypothetical protein